MSMFSVFEQYSVGTGTASNDNYRINRKQDNMFSSLILIFLFYGLCLFALCCDSGIERIREIRKTFSLRQKLMLAGIFAFFLMFILYWVKQDRYVYFWDYSAYWSFSINRMKFMFSNSFADNIMTLVQSINNDEYNMFLPSVIALPLGAFGYTFSKYVLICAIMFLVPSFLVQGLIVHKMVKNENIAKNNLFLAAILFAVCFAGNYYAVLRGYIDAAFLLPMSAAMYLFIDYDYKRISHSRNAAIALSLLMTWICRRYTIFFIIGYVAAMIVKAAALLVQEKSLKSLKMIILNLSEIGIISLGILLIFFRQFFLRALFNSYGNTYAAYDDPLKIKIKYLAESFGLYSCVLVAAVGVMCFISKKHIVNYISLSLMSVTEIIVFWQIQNMSRHHRMILNLPVFILLMMLFEHWEKIKKPLKKNIKLLIKNGIVALCLLLMMFNFVKSFSNELSINQCGKIWSERYYPLQRDDMDVLNVLCDRLNELTEETDDHVYVLASGTTFNCDILRKLHMPDTDNAVPNMYNTHDVDLRDGFNPDFLNADYIVTTDSIQTHLNIGQEIITYLANGVKDENSYIGCHFEYMEEYELEGGVKAIIYKKTSEFSESDLQQLRDYFTNLYPGYELIFSDRI